MTNLVIFDLDGTLLNTLADLSAAVNAALVQGGFAPRSLKQVQHFVGNGVEKLLLRALPDGYQTPENLARLKPAFFAYYDGHLWDYSHPYDGICTLLQSLQQRGVLLAVASNKYQRATEKLVAHFFPQIDFAAVLGQQAGRPTKPDPFIVQEILARARMTAQEALYVGDSDVDMQTAANARVTVCGVTWGFKTRDVLQAFHPAYLIDTPQELLTLL